MLDLGTAVGINEDSTHLGSYEPRTLDAIPQQLMENSIKNLPKPLRCPTLQGDLPIEIALGSTS